MIKEIPIKDLKIDLIIASALQVAINSIKTHNQQEETKCEFDNELFVIKILLVKILAYYRSEVISDSFEDEEWKRVLESDKRVLKQYIEYDFFTQNQEINFLNQMISKFLDEKLQNQDRKDNEK